MHTPFPPDGHELAWRTRDADDEPVESVTIRWDNEAWTITDRLHDHGVDYVLRVSPRWELRQFLLFRDLAEPDLWLGTDGRGGWGEVNGVRRPELDGPHDLVVAGSAFGWTVPVRRLGLPVGAEVAVPLLVVDVETLGVVLGAVTVGRTDEHRWRVDDVEFDVDGHGVPVDLADRVRLAPR